ncbi:MAG: FUSC family protein [Rhodanobacteraceae bacterium]
MKFAARLPRHPLLQTLLRTQRRDVPWTVALRNTAAIVLPLALGAATNHLGVGLGISAGALNTMYADQPGPYRLRLQRMLLTALAAAVAAFAGSVLGHWSAALLIALAVWGFAAALLVAIGPNATRAGLIGMILLVVLGADPQSFAQAIGVALLIFAGGVLQTLFAVAAWPLQRYRPERFALAHALHGLADTARENVGHGDVDAMAPSLNDLQVLLFGEGRARGRAVEAFRVLAELAERMRIELLALADLQSACTSEPLRDALQSVRFAAARVLDTLALTLEQAAPPRAQAALAEYVATSASFGQADELNLAEPALAPIAAARVLALGGQLRAAARNADAAGSRGEIRAQRGEFHLPPALRPANPLETLRANLRFSSPAFRHAVRCGVCLAIALALSHLLPLSRGYWLPMTVAIVLRPDFGATWRVGLLRVAGTLGGLLLTTALLQFAGFGNFWVALTLMAVLCFAYRELATVHYGIAVVCLTGLVVILLSFYGIPPETAVHARALDTVLGSALALLAYLLWPTWERGRERAVLAGMLDAYRDYLRAVLHGDPRARHDTRSAARAARSGAQWRAGIFGAPAP